MRARPRRPAVSLLALLAIAAATAAWPAPAAAEPRDVKVMSFNVWLGGDVVDFGKAVEVIERSEADIVGLQEAEGATRKLAKALRWRYWSDRLHVVSKYPLIDPPEANGEYVFAQVRPGEVFALANVHLTSDPYGPYAVRDGQSLGEVLTLEREARVPEIEQTLGALEEIVDAGIPTLLAGDFNTPSHLDWTAAAAAARGLRYPVPWPVTSAVQAAGFRDTYRAAHPDPVAAPGITWTFGYPFPRLEEGEVVDRIDMVHAANATEVLDSRIVGPPGTPDASVTVDPYPSDHRAVVSTVRLEPAEPPPFASVLDRRVERGEKISVRYAAPGGPDSDRIAIVREGGGPDAALMWLPPQEAGSFGNVTFGSGALRPGRHDAILVTAGDRVVLRSTFWVVLPSARPAVRPARRAYRAGEPIGVAWRDTHARRRDWVGIYAAGDPDLYSGYLGFAYTGATVAGSTAFEGDAETYPPGRYVVRLMDDDGYRVLAESSFRVLPGAR